MMSVGVLNFNGSRGSGSELVESNKSLILFLEEFVIGVSLFNCMVVIIVTVVIMSMRGTEGTLAHRDHRGLMLLEPEKSLS